MNREIKFRAWDKRRNLMIGSDYENNWNEDRHYWDEWYSDFNYICLTGIEKASKDGNLILMQFTGLKDKNGKKIYESDILEAKIKYKDSFVLHVVVFTMSENESKFSLPFPLSQSEVIGNIFENPELIKNDN